MTNLRLGDIIKDVRRTDLIITPNLNEWLIQHGDDALPKDIARLIYNQLVTKPRDRSASFSASSAGACYRAQELGFLGMPSSEVIGPRLAMIFQDGKWRHLRWQATLLHAGLLDKMEMPLFWRAKKSRGTIDGLGTVKDDHPRTAFRGLEYGFELKGTNPFVYNKAVKQDKGVKEEHEKQVSRYFLMGGFDLFVTIYENKATQEWFEWVSWPDQALIDVQREELDELNWSIDNKQLHDMLPQCKLQAGPLFNDCPYGGKQGVCLKSGDWPNIRNNNKKKRKP